MVKDSKVNMEERKSKPGRKPKYDYTGDEFLLKIEGLAKKGFTDREIAVSIGLCYQTFSEKKSAINEIAEALSRGRATVNATVRAAFLQSALGRVVKRTEYVKQKCSRCEGHGMIADKNTGVPSLCPDCGGTGWIRLTDRAVVSEQEIPPSIQAQMTWLLAHDEEWKRALKGNDESDLNKITGIDVEVTYNKKEDLELQGRMNKTDETEV